MTMMLGGLLVGVVLAVARVAVRRRATPAPVFGLDREGLPSRQRDPETGEAL